MLTESQCSARRAWGTRHCTGSHLARRCRLVFTLGSWTAPPSRPWPLRSGFGRCRCPTPLWSCAERGSSKPLQTGIWRFGLGLKCHMCCLSWASLKRSLNRRNTTHPKPYQHMGWLPGGPWDLVSMVLSTLIGVTSSYTYNYPSNNLSY